MRFEVILWANAPRSDYPGYTQIYNVFDYDECIIELREVFSFEEPECDELHHVMSRSVESTSAFDALVKFRNWKENGLEEEYLKRE